jgi:hypothetical protein
MRELVESARNLRVCVSSIEDLGQRLPAADTDLAAVLETAIEAGEKDALTSLLMAALTADRRVDAAILRSGLDLIGDPLSVSIILGHLDGDIIEPILEVTRSGKMGQAKSAQVLLVAALWCRLRGLEVPTGLVTETRMLARIIRMPETRWILLAIAQEVDDEGLWEILGPIGKEYEESVAGISEKVIAHMTDPVLQHLPQAPPPIVHSGFTVRRAVARVGRNDPCPCGSGKKYKKCCLVKDQKRLRDPSEIAGVTREELRQRPEQYLSKERLWEMDRYELLRVAPDKIQPDLLPMLISHLMDLGEYRAAFKVFETIGWQPELSDHHLDVVEGAAMDGEAELVRALMALRPTDAGAVTDLSFAARLALDGDQPGPVLKAIEEEALRVLGDPQKVPADLAYSLIDTSFPALGILVARGAIPIAHPFEGNVLLDHLLKARDQLNLTPSDPIEEVFEALMSASEDWADSDELLHQLKARQEELDTKDSELTRLRVQVAQLQRAIDEHRSAPAVVAPAASPPVVEQRDADAEAAVRELRERLSSVKAALKQRHAERNELRRVVKGMHEEIDQLRERPVKDEGSGQDHQDREHDLLLPAEGMQHHPLRLAEFDARFQADLKAVPERVARSAMRLVGGLCAGDPHSFADARRIKLDRRLWRVRVGHKHRLLFALGSNTVHIISLVVRGDLKKAIARSLKWVAESTLHGADGRAG